MVQQLRGHIAFPETLVSITHLRETKITPAPEDQCPLLASLRMWTHINIPTLRHRHISIIKKKRKS